MVQDIAGNTLDTATSLNLNATNQLFTDSLTPLYKNDYWKFQLGSSSNFNLTLNGISQDVNVELLNNNGVVIKSSYNTGILAETINQNLDIGNYYLRVSLNSNTTASAYNLNLSAQVNPFISISANDSNVGETLTGQTANPGQFILTRIGNLASALTVNYTVAGTATNGTDYTALPGTVTFAAGSSTTLINVASVNDTLSEVTETLTLNLATGTGYNLATGKTATVSIFDNDIPVISINANDANAGEKLTTETANPGQFTLTRIGNLASALTVNYTVAGTATNGTDYTTLPGTVTFAAGSAKALINLVSVDDTLSEATETVTLNLATGTGYNLGTDKTATVNIFDNDIPVISISATDANAGEKLTGQTANPGQFTLTRAGNLASALTINYTVAGTAINGTDYTTLPGTVTFAAGSAKALINLVSVDDTLSEATETATLNLATGTGYNLGTDKTATVNIFDNDIPVISISANDANARETLTGQTANPGQFTLTRAGNVASALTVNYTVAGTATNGTDYTNLPGIVTFAAGSATALIDIVSVDDTLSEATETATLNLATGTGYNLGTTKTATVSIFDNDIPVISMSATDANAGEKLTGQTANPGQFTLTRAGNLASALTVNYTVAGTATTGTDYTTLPGTITFAAGSVTALININTVDDGDFEGNETVIVTLGTGTNYLLGTDKTGTVTIADNDKPTITISATDVNAGETLIGQTPNPGQFTISRNGITTEALTVNYAVQGTATNGTDYDGLSGSVVIPVGQSSITVPINVKDDLITEGNETAVLNLQANSSYVLGNNASGIVRIADSNLGNNLKFDGVDDYLSITLDEPETEITHEFRFKTTDPNAGLFVVANNDLGVDGQDRTIFLKDGNIKARLWNTENIQSTGLNLADGNWHHVAHVFGASVGGQKLYIDGHLVASGSKTASDFNWQKRINIGFSNDAVNKFLNGNIDEVRIWNKTRTQSEIQSYMDHELVGNETGLISYYKFNEPLGTIAVDSSSGQRNAELRNNPTIIRTSDVNFGNNLKLDGVDDYLSIVLDEPETEITHEFRFKTTDPNAGLFAVVDSDLGIDAHDRHIYLTGGNIKARLYNTENIQSTGLNLADGNWHHVAHVFGASVGGQKLYIDGQLVASGNKTVSDFNWQKRINIGFSNDAANKFLNGNIDEVRIWKRTRTQDEIRVYMNQELNGKEAGLIGYWKFNEPLGTVAVDSSSSQLNGQLRSNPIPVNPNLGLPTNPNQWNVSLINRTDTNFSDVNSYDFNHPDATTTIEKFNLNGNLKFDGVDDYVNLPTMTFGGAVTVESWVFVDQHQFWQCIIDFGNGTANNNILLSWYENTGKMVWETYQGASSQKLITNDVFPTNQWVHVAAVNDGQGKGYIYWNGELKASGNVLAALNVTRNNNYIGRSNWSPDAYFKGKMDDVRVWNTARTQTDIKNSLNKELTGNEAGLIGYWKLNEGAGNIAADSTITKRNGSLINNPTWNQGGLASLRVDFGLGSPATNIQNDYFAMQAWTTTKLETGKTYQVTTQSNDGTRFFVKNLATGEITYIGADWRDRAANELTSTTFFKVNQTGDYDFYVQHYEHGGGSSLNIELKETPANAIPNHTGLINDINKDGKTDILWRYYGNGATHFWSMNGATRLGDVDIPDYLDMAWHPVAMADFNNDGNMDIVWRYHWVENIGYNRVWLMNGNTRISEFDIERVADNNWHIVGTGDFNLDGNADILWRNYASGDNLIWRMSGTTHIGDISLDSATDLNQRIVGTGDFNGDGKSDILWRNAATGKLSLWFTNFVNQQVQITKSDVADIPGNGDLGWSVAGTGDMNNDGKSDIILRYLPTGGNHVWLMNSATHIGDLDIPDVSDRTWNIVGDSDQIPIWTAEYFGNKDLTGTPTSTEGFINITGGFSKNWGLGAPPNTPVDNFSARYKTQQSLAPGLYKINASSDDGVRVWIDNQLVINDWTDSAGNRSGYFSSAGGYYPVTIEYKEAGGTAGLNYEIVKYQPYDTFGDGVGLINSWNATFFTWNGQATPIMDDAHKIGTVKLTGNVRGDGQWGMDLQNWGAGSPAPGVPVDNFAMHAYTRAGLTAGHTYEVWVRSDDGYQVFAHKLGGSPFNITPNALNGEWQPGAYGNAVKWTFVAPESGTFDFKINMFEGGGNAYVELVLKDVTATPPPTGYYGELNTLSEDQWDQQSGDDNQFRSDSPFGGGDQRWKTDDRIEQIYTDLSNTIFGSRVDMNTGYAYDQGYHDYYGTWHAGLDMGASNGATIKAVVGGSVAWIDGSADGYVFVGINSDDGRQWVYGHLKSSSGLSNGKRINAGDTVGLVGALNHLHLEVRNSPNSGGTGGAMTDQNKLLSITVSPLMAYWQWRNKNSSNVVTSPSDTFTTPTPVPIGSFTTSSKGLEFIGQYEGLSLTLYDDPAGHATIGYGHLVHYGSINGTEPQEFKQGITKERALQLLAEDAANAAQAVKNLVKVALNQAQFDALVSFTFNLGRGNLETSDLLTRLNNGEYSAVPYELSRWKYGGGVVLPGLVRRRQEEGILFSNGTYTGIA